MFGLGMSCNGQLTNASMAYLPYMAYNPFGITNFGGDIQIFPVDNYQQSQIGLAFNQLAQASGWPAGIFSGYSLCPQFNPYAAINLATAMAAQSLNQLGSQEINEGLQIIAGQKAKIQAQLQAKDLKAEDKAELEEQLKKLEELEKQINDIKTSGMDPQSAYLKANELKVAVKNLIMGKDNPSTQATDDTSSQSADSSSDSSSGSSGTDSSSDSDSVSGSPSGNGSSSKPSDFSNWVDAFHDATFRAGTDDELFNLCCEQITPDDVVERMVQWNQSYPNESFMEAFMADADYDQKRAYGKKIQRALRSKAQELGIDLTNDPDYQKICKEMDSWFWIDNSVADNFNAVIKRLAQKMGYDYDYQPYTIESK